MGNFGPILAALDHQPEGNDMNRLPPAAPGADAPGGSPSTTVLISCCGEKLDHPAPARLLYRSQLFRKSVAWADAHGLPWLVLSAAHCVIDPDAVLAPYDVTLGRMARADRDAWDRRVAMTLQMRFRGGRPPRFVLLAGQAYAGWLPAVQGWCQVDQPLQGMQIGQRLQWLTDAERAARAAATHEREAAELRVESATLQRLAAGLERHAQALRSAASLNAGVTA